ncbi:MAG TPA: 3-oxo-tetronate kinase [Microbacterium sp.]|uniref:3-oxo-tetronate kinase n=1 Tax=Microbacterium sp. TaxID=51671 RepID=UPI002CC00E46|nr:3-oxo-tetronate kinase [Microbacterium sp.]HWI30032.1 3-oxo-tetronate kinase [Microbacterium sp.]
MIGAIADDFTGATDVAVAFRRAGLRTVVFFGLPTADTHLPEHDAVVIGLKTRTIPADQAVEQSLAALRWLQSHRTEQFFFKYCSTFDSRPEGNIGPVADALADHLGAGLTAVTPSSPEHGRTQYLGHLFVGGALLSDSPMSHHPLTPMTDSLIPRVLQAQTTRPVSLVSHDVVRAGEPAIREELLRLRNGGVRYAVIDAVDDEDLVAIGRACSAEILVTGAAGLAGGVGLVHAERLSSSRRPPNLDPVGEVPAVALAGSCSARTLEQIAVMAAHHDSYFLDAVAVPDSAELARGALAWYDGRNSTASALIYSSVPADRLRMVQAELGVERASAILEGALAEIARALVARGVRRLVIAGGETSGAVVTALDVRGGLIGEELAPGVPWIYTVGEEPLALMLKSGNFGEPDLLLRAVSVRESEGQRA